MVSKYSPYRAVVTLLLDNIYQIADAAEEEDEKITVIVPQFMTHGLLASILHNHTGLFIRESLLKKGYPYNLDNNDYVD